MRVDDEASDISQTLLYGGADWTVVPQRDRAARRAAARAGVHSGGDRALRAPRA